MIYEITPKRDLGVHIVAKNLSLKHVLEAPDFAMIGKDTSNDFIHRFSPGCTHGKWKQGMGRVFTRTLFDLPR